MHIGIGANNYRKAGTRQYAVAGLCRMSCMSRPRALMKDCFTKHSMSFYHTILELSDSTQYDRSPVLSTSSFSSTAMAGKLGARSISLDGTNGAPGPFAPGHGMGA